MQNSQNQNYSGGSILSEIDSALVNYTSSIVETFSSELEDLQIAKPKVLDFGSGIGTLAEIWRSKFEVSPDCLEIDPISVDILAKLGFKTYQSLDVISYKYDLIYSSNVLEHIEDDSKVLSDLRDLLNLNGIICVYVPAFPILFSKLDSSVGHFRRYTKKNLINRFTSAGFEVVKCEYRDSLGFFVTLLLKFTGYSFKSSRPNQMLLSIYDRYFFPISKFLDYLGFRKFLGKNLLLTAKIELSQPEYSRKF